MQLFCSHNDFNLKQFLSHCRHPLQVERSDIYMHVHTCIHTYIRGGSRINCSGGLSIPCEILCATPTLDVISAQDMYTKKKLTNKIVAIIICKQRSRMVFEYKINA